MSHELELRWLASLSRRLPRVRAARYLARRLRKFYLRRPREDVVAEVAGQRMRLSPADVRASASTDTTLPLGPTACAASSV